MSRKIATFAQFITQPLNKHNFQVVIPGVPEAIIVESTTFPTDKLREVVMWFQGEQVRYPGLPENGGAWKVTIPEGDNGQIRARFMALRNRLFNQATGTILPDIIWDTIQVHARDLSDNIVFSVNMHGCWLKGAEPQGLNASQPAESWKWDYEFVYQWIEDSPIAGLPGSESPLRVQ